MAEDTRHHFSEIFWCKRVVNLNILYLRNIILVNELILKRYLVY